MSLMQREDLKRARAWFSAACGYSREHAKLAKQSLAKYGDHGPTISGCVREHFPRHIKERLRYLARRAGQMSDVAYAARPPRVRMSTMRKLAREVAQAEGSGFYGPQP